MRLFFSLVSLIVALSLAGAASAQAVTDNVVFEESVAKETFVKANTAYESQSYQQAIELYRTLIDHGYSSGPLYYNLGNAELRLELTDLLRTPH